MNMVRAAKLIGAGLAITSISGAGVGIGLLFGLFIVALGRTPYLEKKLFAYVILGFALTEAVALMGVMFSVVIMFSK